VTVSKSFSKPPLAEFSEVSKYFVQLVLFAGVALAPVVTLAAPPEWLRQLEAVPVPAYDDETDAVTLLDDEEATVLPDGSVRYLERRAYRILRRGGQARGVAQVFLDKNDELVSFRGWSIPTSGKPFETDKKDIVESALVPGSEIALTTDARKKVLTIPAANPGNLVGYVVERISHSPLMGEQWSPRDSIPVLRARFRLRLPVGWTHSATWINGGSAKPVSPEPGTWEWEVTNLEALQSEEHAPPFRLMAEMLLVALHGPAGKPSSFRNWNELGAWFTAQLNARAEVNAAISSGIATRSANKATQFEKVKALSEFAQKDLRYVHIALGTSGYQPRPPAEVLQTGFGDCKDKANFLRVMLREIGVESHLVLVNTERGIVRSDSLPATLFDHAVIAIRLPGDGSTKPRNDMAMIDDGKGGGLLLFDPTDTLTPFGGIGEHLRANTVLLVSGDSARLVPTPPGSPADNGVNRTVSMKLTDDGALVGTVRENWRGVWAGYERERMMEAGQNADLIKPLEGRLSGSIANFHIENAVVDSRTNIEKPLEWRYSLSAGEYARKAGDLIMIRPRVLGSKVNRFLETNEPRRNPVSFDATHRDVDTMRIELPQGFVVETLPEPVTLDNSFAAYRSNVRIEGSVLVYERVFELKDLDLPLARIEELKDFYRAISRDERAMAVFRKKASP
jgi:hypothetical protein